MNSKHQLPIIKEPATWKKDLKNRLGYYHDWLLVTNRPWYLPDLDAYRDFLASKTSERELSPSSVVAHISTVKNIYREIGDRPNIRELIAEFAPQEGVAAAVEAIRHAIKPEVGRLEARRQPKIKHLSQSQIDELLSKPDVTTCLGQRDKIIIGLLLCAGISEVEVSALGVQAPGYAEDDRWAINVPEIPGRAERLAPVYDDIFQGKTWLKDALDELLVTTEVYTGTIFRGFRRDGKTLRPEPVHPRTLRLMLKGYAVHDADSGNEVTFTALDLNRTYARRLYLAGIPVEIIQENLGHKNIGTTWEYIGPPNIQSSDEENQSSNTDPLDDSDVPF